MESMIRGESNGETGTAAKSCLESPDRTDAAGTGQRCVMGLAGAVFDANSVVFKLIYPGTGLSVPDAAAALSGTNLYALVPDRGRQYLFGAAQWQIYPSCNPAMRDGRGTETYGTGSAVYGKEHAAGHDAPDIGTAGGCDLENTLSVSDGQPGEYRFSDLDSALSDGGGQTVAAVGGGISILGGGGLRRFGGLAGYFSCDTSMERGMEGIAALFVPGGRVLSWNLLWAPI